jgi:hypothetical protein
VDKVVLTMRQHESRSMLDNKKVIDARKKATDWAIQNLQVSISDQRILKAWYDYFCGFHYYLDNKGGKAIRQAFSAIKKTGPDRKFIFLLIKAIVGRKFIEWLKKV